MAVRMIGGGADRSAGMLERLGRRVGGDAHGGALPRLAGRGLVRAGGTLRTLLGSETLRHTSLEVSGGFGVGVPGPLSGVLYLGVVETAWSGSIDYFDRRAEFSEGHGKLRLASPFKAIGGRVGGDAAPGARASGLPSIGAKVSDRGFALSAGLPFVASLSLGEVHAAEPGQYDHGSYLGIGAGLPLGPVRFGWNVDLYYPPLAALTRHLRGPAERVEKLQNAIVDRLDRATRPTRDRLDRATRPTRDRLARATKPLRTRLERARRAVRARVERATKRDGAWGSEAARPVD